MPSDPSPTQIGVQGPTRINDFVLVMGKVKGRGTINSYFCRRTRSRTIHRLMEIIPNKKGRYLSLPDEVIGRSEFLNSLHVNHDKGFDWIMGVWNNRSFGGHGCTGEKNSSSRYHVEVCESDNINKPKIDFK